MLERGGLIKENRVRHLVMKILQRFDVDSSPLSLRQAVAFGRYASLHGFNCDEMAVFDATINRARFHVNDLDVFQGLKFPSNLPASLVRKVGELAAETLAPGSVAPEQALLAITKELHKIGERDTADKLLSSLVTSGISQSSQIWPIIVSLETNWVPKESLRAIRETSPLDFDTCMTSLRGAPQKTHDLLLDSKRQFASRENIVSRAQSLSDPASRFTIADFLAKTGNFLAASQCLNSLELDILSIGQLTKATRLSVRARNLANVERLLFHLERTRVIDRATPSQLAIFSRARGFVAHRDQDSREASRSPVVHVLHETFALGSGNRVSGSEPEPDLDLPGETRRLIETHAGVNDAKSFLRNLKHFDYARDLYGNQPINDLIQIFVNQHRENPNAIVTALRHLDDSAVNAIGFDLKKWVQRNITAVTLVRIDSRQRNHPLLRDLREMVFNYWLEPIVENQKRIDLVSEQICNDFIKELWKIDHETPHKLASSMQTSNIFLTIQKARAVALYWADKFPEAHRLLSDCLEQNPDDRLAESWKQVVTGRLSKTPTISGKDSIPREYVEASRPGYERLFGARWAISPEFSKIANQDKSLAIIPLWDGVSDEVRRAMFIPQLQEAFRHVYLVCDPRFETLFRTSFPGVTLLPFRRHNRPSQVDKRENALADYGPNVARHLPKHIMNVLPDIDYAIPMRALANLAESGALTRPEPGPYLLLDSTTSNDSEKHSGRRKVGVSWRSGLLSGSRSAHSLTLKEIAPLFSTDNVDFLSLQHALTPEEREMLDDLGIPESPVDTEEDFTETAKFLRGLDVVVGISTLTTELSAALGIKTWIPGFDPFAQTRRLSRASGSRDLLTLNAEVIAPATIDFRRARAEIVNLTIQEIANRL